MEKEIDLRSLAMEKLYPYQQEHITKLITCAEENKVIIDASDPGTGKTAIMCALCSIMGIPMFVICPKSVIGAWFQFTEIFGAKAIGISNYELIKNGKYYTSIDEYNNNKPKQCPYIKPIVGARNTKFIISLPECFVIFDEAHKGKNYRTQNSNLMICVKEYFDRISSMKHDSNHNYKIAILSATIGETIDDFRITSYMLGISQFGKHAYEVWKRQLSIKYPNLTQAEAISREVFPKYGARMKISSIVSNESLSTYELSGINDTVIFRRCYHLYKFIIQLEEHTGNAPLMDVMNLILTTYNLIRSFKKTHISARVFTMSPEAETEITAAWDEIHTAIESLKNKQIGEIHPLTIILRARQRIEMLKIPTMVELAMEYLVDNKAVIMFVNFTDTINKLRTSLEGLTTELGSAVTLVHGGQSTRERDANIEAFQLGKSILMLVNSSAGGTGLSFHHINHNALPRVTIISPPWTGIMLKQILGRVHRAGSLSDSEQVIVYCKGNVSSIAGNDTTFIDGDQPGAGLPQRVGIEEIMAAKVNKKLTTIEYFNNGDDSDLNLI